MLKAFSPNRIGGLRFIASYLLCGDDTNGGYIEWLERGTEAVKAEAEEKLREWYERTFENGDWDKGVEAHDILIKWATACERPLMRMA